MEPLLRRPATFRAEESPISPERVSLVAIKIRYLVEAVVCVEIKPSLVTRPRSRVVKKRVLNLIWEAGGQDKACVIFCLLMCRKYFKHKASTDLVDSDLYYLREIASEHIAKLIIDSVQMEQGLLDSFLTKLLLQRYSILRNGSITPPMSAVELAIDGHAIRVIATNNYQHCIRAIWRGYSTIQYDDEGRLAFGQYHNLYSTSFIDHFDPQRMKVPLYQNIHNLCFTFLFIVFYTITVNKPDLNDRMDFVEWCLFILALGFFFDGMVKIIRGGMIMLKFWHIYHVLLHGAFTICFILRIVESVNRKHEHGELLSFDLLACLAPFLYCRLLLHLNFFRFFGTMIIILEKMIKETAIFFLLLIVVAAGFLQSFISLDSGHTDVLKQMLHSMTQTFLNSPNFEFYENIRPPFGIILFYLYSSIVSILLLNILIALFNQAYSVVTDHAVDEFLALFSNKTLEYIRAPDENTFCPPYNLIKIFLILPTAPFLKKSTYQSLNEMVMKVVFFPSLCLIAFYESQFQARELVHCHLSGLNDGDEVSGWDIENEFDPDASGWTERLTATIPHIDEDEMFLLRRMEWAVRAVVEKVGAPKTWETPGQA